MFLDHPTLTATNSQTEPDRIERLNRVYGYVMALADRDGLLRLVEKVSQLHDHKGTLIVFWIDAPDESEKALFSVAWGSRIGDGTSNVEHEI
ncbi:hypothetical protein [Massilia sp. DWR3-1-1]|jgi:hypothetical protein|uniref:hypothetical protein n=1 Tax=Massilia sp. DWR3-1-1 TaxID=2804559 RepID=UPI003CE9CD95